jgi:hypothetical protein
MRFKLGGATGFIAVFHSNYQQQANSESIALIMIDLTNQ